MERLQREIIERFERIQRRRDAREDLRELGADLGPEHFELILAHGPLWARSDQLPPAGDNRMEPWRVWLILGGRGAGKTRTGAEWVSAKALGRALSGPPAAMRIALVGETIGDVRRVMIEGVSGLLSVHTARERPHFEPSKGQLIWASGAIAQIFSAEDPDSLRGPQFDAAWCDEFAKWRHPSAPGTCCSSRCASGRIRKWWRRRRRGQRRG